MSPLRPALSLAVIEAEPFGVVMLDLVNLALGILLLIIKGIVSFYLITKIVLKDDSQPDIKVDYYATYDKNKQYWCYKLAIKKFVSANTYILQTFSLQMIWLKNMIEFCIILQIKLFEILAT